MQIAENIKQTAMIVGIFFPILHCVELVQLNDIGCLLSKSAESDLSTLNQKRQKIENNSRRKRNIQLCPKLTTGN
jgi:hypothetical protein